MIRLALPLVFVVACAGTDDPQPCGTDDLSITAHVRPYDGTDRPLVAKDRVSLGVVVYNPCEGPVTFRTPHVCLTGRFTLTDPDRRDRSGGPDCAGAPRDWRIEPGEGEAVRFELGVLPAGDYSATVPVEFSEAVAKVSFSVPD